MIRPTVGRMIWYRPKPDEDISQRDGQPLAAVVTGVHYDDDPVTNRTLVNVSVFGFNGTGPHFRLGIAISEDNEPAPGECCWMPYQKGQAAKAEALEQQLKSRDPFDHDGDGRPGGSLPRRHPFDHDGDGKPGGSLPQAQSAPAEPAAGPLTEQQQLEGAPPETAKQD
jgi:hypothetical protein